MRQVFPALTVKTGKSVVAVLERTTASVLTTSGQPKGGRDGAYCQAAAERGVTPAGC